MTFNVQFLETYLIPLKDVFLTFSGFHAFGEVCVVWWLQGVVYWPDKTDEHLEELIGYCRYYFPLEATQEMLEEWRPMLCPFDESMTKAMQYFSTFLPTMLKPSQSQYGFKLWLEVSRNLAQFFD